MSDNLENMLQDAYIVSVKKESTPTAEAAAQQYSALEALAGQLEEQYSVNIFHCYRRFQHSAAIAAIIKDEGIVSLLEQQGYVVEKQARMDAT